MESFKTVLQEYAQQPVDFVVVYIEEAHPTDEWAFENNTYQIQQPNTLQERMAAARVFANDTEISCPILVDNMQNETNIAYGALPERLYIVHNNKIAFIGGRGPHDYSLDKLKKTLDALLRQAAKDN